MTGINKNFNFLNIIDIECTCWNEEFPQGDQVRETIEIGICEIDVKQKKVTRKDSYLIKPIASEINPFCTSITGYTPKDLENGLTFAEAIERVKEEYQVQRRYNLSWGGFDLRVLLDNCRYFNVKPPFYEGSWINIKPIICLRAGMGKSGGESKTLEVLGMKFEGIPHKGIWDAYNTARMVIKTIL